ncbi:MAG: glycosyltransferase family 4 protein [Acidobacteria bacterium]|nr:glycosyltransferase family 4 protein [Acidobacteriota bacterium]MBV9478293.1 glycosyltransferase family 4 protein [Acidobacteriota bacterium]
MKIAFIEPSGKGGMIHYAFQLCRAMANAGADVTLITEKSYELASLPHNFRVEPTIELWDPKPSGRVSTAWWAVAWRKTRRVTRAVRYYREWLRMTRRVRKLAPDLVLLGDIRFPFDLFPLMLLRRNARVLADICHNVHPFSAGGKSAGLFDRSARRAFFYRRIYRLFDFVFVHFARNRDEFVRSFPVPASRVDVIYHGNEEIFRELRAPGVDANTLRRRLNLPANEPVILFFGTLSRYKGTDVLIEAFARMRQKDRARLVLAGFPFHDFDVRKHQELTERLGISDRVTWVPEYIDSAEVAAWMELASAIVFPYRDIYQSGAIHVAQTFGVPIVASAVGAMQDVVENDVSGLLVPTGDADALARALERLLDDPQLAARLGARAAEDARTDFGWDAIARIITARLA